MKEGFLSGNVRMYKWKKALFKNSDETKEFNIYCTIANQILEVVI